MTKGWKQEPARHSLASKGVRTKVPSPRTKVLSEILPKKELIYYTGSDSGRDIEIGIKSDKGKAIVEVILESPWWQELGESTVPVNKPLSKVTRSDILKTVEKIIKDEIEDSADSMYKDAKLSVDSDVASGMSESEAIEVFLDRITKIKSLKDLRKELDLDIVAFHKAANKLKVSEDPIFF